jgi:hypothetical protein
MRAPISEAVIIVVLGFLIGGIAAAIIHFAVQLTGMPAGPLFA